MFKKAMNQDKLHTFHLDGKQFRYLTSLWFMFLCHLKYLGLIWSLGPSHEIIFLVSSQLVIWSYF